jgi:transposase
VPRVGLVLPSTLLAFLQELGTLTNKQIAALVGVAPLNRDSGTLRGRGSVRGGRAQVRAVMYMGALVAARFNPVIRVFYQRLQRAGKAKKMALTACMRKLLTNSQCDAETSNTLAREGGIPCLNRKTVADTLSLRRRSGGMAQESWEG